MKHIFAHGAPGGNASTAPDGRGNRRVGLWAFLALVFLMLLFASGRLSSGDAGTQLQATTVLVRTGHLGLAAPPGNNSGLWIQAPSGSFYQCHDPGNLALMALPAWVASRVDRRPDAEAFSDPPLASKLVVSLLYAMLGAWSAWMVQEIASKRSERRTGLLIGLASLFCTIAIAYSKAAWDVMGGYAFAWWHVKASLELADGTSWKTRKILELAAATSFALWFRYSLAPFLFISVAGQAWSQRDKWRPRQIGAAILLAAILLVPVFAYNALRMGSPLVPATRHIQFQQSNALSGNILSGAGALLVSPNRGLFFHAPVFLLLFPALASLRRLPSGRERSALAWMLAATCAYFAMIAKMNNPCAFGWGPRYLLPVLPFLFAPIALLLATRRRWSMPTRIILGFSAVVNLPAAVANWHSTATGSDDILLQWSWPRHQLATWRSIWRGLGELASPTLPPSAEGFPNFWWWRLGEQGRYGPVMAALVFTALASGLALSLRAWRKTL